MRRISNPHKTYIEPTDSEISKYFKDQGYDPPKDMESFRSLLNGSSYFYRGEDPKNCLRSLEELRSIYQTLTPSDLDRLHHNKKMLSSLRLEQFEGNTPLEISFKAAVLANMTQKTQGDGEEEDDEYGENVCQYNQEKTERLQKIDRQIKANDFLKKVLQFGRDLNEEELKDLSEEDMKFLEYLSLFDEFVNIQASSIRTTEEDEFSRKKKSRPIREYAEVSKVSPIYYAMPHFSYKFATKQLNRVIGYEERFQKQILVLVIDDSGSMNEKEKRALVKAILVNRCQAVIKGDATLYVATYEADLDPFVKLETEEDCLAVVKKFFTFSRGGTDIQRAIEKISNMMENGKIDEFVLEGRNPQIVFLHDGQDHVDPDFEPSVPTHGFMLGQDNSNMKSICYNSSGSYTLFRVG